MRIPFAASMLVVAIAVPSAYGSITVTPFGPSAFNINSATMNATLGITGYTIESFTDTTLATGLTYQLSGPSPYGPSGVTPATIQSTFDPGPFSNHWDDNYVLINNNTNAIPDNGQRAITTTFFFPAGTTSVGIGLSNAQSISLSNTNPVADHELFINGVSFGLLESYPGFVAGRMRNIYLRIDAAGLDSISSVAFTTLNNRSNEILAFDHIAFIPTPGTAALLGLGGLASLGRRRRTW